MEPSDYEYGQGTCDVWQVSHLVNHWAGLGWEFVAIFPSYQGIQVPARISKPDEALHEAILPYEVLFRRPIELNAEEVNE